MVETQVPIDWSSREERWFEMNVLVPNPESNTLVGYEFQPNSMRGVREQSITLIEEDDSRDVGVKVRVKLRGGPATDRWRASFKGTLVLKSEPGQS